MTLPYLLIKREGNRTTVVFYDRHKDNYVGAVQVVKYGRRGLLDTLIGRGMVEALVKRASEMFEKLDVDQFEAEATNANCKLLRRALIGVCSVEFVGESEVAGRKMKRIAIKLV